VFSQDYTYKDLFSVSFRLDISEKRVPYELNIFFLQQYLCITYLINDMIVFIFIGVPFIELLIFAILIF